MAQPQYAEARANLTETLVRRAEKELTITRGELNAYRERKGDVPVELRSAEPLSREQVSRIRNAVLRALRDAGETPKEEEICITDKYSDCPM